MKQSVGSSPLHLLQPLDVSAHGHTRPDNSSPMTRTSSALPTSLLPDAFTSEAHTKVRIPCRNLLRLVITYVSAEIRSLHCTRRHFDFRLPLSPHRLHIFLLDLLRMGCTHPTSHNERQHGKSKCLKNPTLCQPE